MSHVEQTVAIGGTLLDDADIAIVMLHGRGSDAAGILSLRSYLDQPGVAYVAPQAEDNTWYPQRFIAPRAANEPYLSSALDAVNQVLKTIADAGIPPEKTIIMGFSQGACLAVEAAARNPQRYGGVAALSGGLIGAPGELTGYEGSLSGTSVFLGCSDVDFHIPLERVDETASILESLGATVDKRIYPGMGHTINEDEIQALRNMIYNLSSDSK